MDEMLEVPLISFSKFQVVSNKLKNMYVAFSDFNPGLRTSYLVSRSSNRAAGPARRRARRSFSCMQRFIAQRAASLVFTLIAISIAIFMLVRLLPGNVIDLMLGGDANATPELRQRAKEQLGLTGSYPEQYWRWISHMFQGDLGRSLYTSQPISETLRTALPITIELVFLGLLIAVWSACRSASSRPSGATASTTTAPGSRASSGSASRTSGSRRCS